MDNLMERCACAGEYRTLLDRDEFVRLLRTFGKLADSYGMNCLRETVDFTLRYV